jgi:F0F1-type ATP synthase assembly protein I
MEATSRDAGNVKGAQLMLKKIISAVVVGAIAKVVLDRLTGSSSASKDDADLWAEATDAVPPGK